MRILRGGERVNWFGRRAILFPGFLSNAVRAKMTGKIAFYRYRVTMCLQGSSRCW